MKIIFMGTPDFAVAALRKLITSDAYQIVSVYSQPPRPANRGQKICASPVQTLAEKHSIPIYTPLNFHSETDCNSFITQNADIAVVAAYGLLLPKKILTAPTFGCN